MSYHLRNLVDRSTLPRREKTVAREVAWYVRDDDPSRLVQCTVQQIAHRTGYADRTVRTMMGLLRRRKILTIARPYQRGAHRWYHFKVSGLPGVTVSGQIEMSFAQGESPES